MPCCFAAERLYFMNTVEKLGYLKGLLDGLDFDDNKKETKMFKAVIDVLDGIMQDMDGLGEDVDLLAEQVDEIDQDLADVEEYLEDEDYCDCCDDDEEMMNIAFPARIAARNLLLTPTRLMRAA